jgi:hypothetical protein
MRSHLGCSVRPCSHRDSCFTDDKASRIAVAVDVDCSFVNKRYRDLDFLRKVRVRPIVCRSALAPILESTKYS